MIVSLNVCFSEKPNTTCGPHKHKDSVVTSGGSKGDAKDAPPPWSKFFQFHTGGNLAKLCVGAPLESWRPHLRKILDPPLVTGTL